MASKKNIISNNKIEYRLSTHEKVCAERMKTLFKSMDEVKKEIKELRNDVLKGKGAISVLLILGSFVAGVIGFFQFSD